MNITSSEIYRAMDMVATSMQRYLQSEHRITCLARPVMTGKVDSVALREFTATVGLGGVVSHLAVISFERRLLMHLLRREMNGLGVHDSAQEGYLAETAAEISNIVIGNSLANLEVLFVSDIRIRRRIFMAPPDVSENLDYVHQAHRSAFTSVPLHTGYGALLVALAWPHELFENLFKDVQLKEKST
jgi:CheY-specific phosphatase CheX